MMTVRGNLIRFKKYYQTFVQLNNKEDKSYMHYPFSNAFKDEYEEDVLIMYSILKRDIDLYNQTNLSWIMHNIILGHQNDCHHKIAVFIFYKTITDQLAKVDKNLNIIAYESRNFDSLHYVNQMISVINRRMLFFVKELETIETLDWMPNE
jgi:hypothetical protein